MSNKQFLVAAKTEQRVRRVRNFSEVIPRGRRPAARKKEIKAGTARGIHLFPSRTEKLSHAAPMVLRKRESRSPPHEGKPGQRAIAARASLFCTKIHPARRAAMVWRLATARGATACGRPHINCLEVVTELHNMGSVRKPGCIHSYNPIKIIFLCHETMASITNRIS